MSTQRDYYEVLGIPRGAGAGEIKTAYRRLARELHPDKNTAPDAAARFAEVQRAYDVLSDESTRREYDRFGHDAPGAPGRDGAGQRRGTYTWTNVGAPQAGEVSDVDVSAIFEEMFGRGEGAPGFGGFAGSARSRSRPSRGRDIEQDLPVGFLDALRGCKPQVRVRRGGSSQTLEVSVPPGVSDGSKLRVRGAGSPSGGSGTPGDLILTVRIAPHPHFRREGLDVSMDLPLTIAEAALGTSVRVPTPAGQAELVVPPGTSSGQKLRLRGQGARTEDGKFGDLLLWVKVVAPKELSPTDEQILRELSRHLPSPRVGPPWTEA